MLGSRGGAEMMSIDREEEGQQSCIQRDEWLCARHHASPRWPLATQSHKRTGIGIPCAPVSSDRPNMVEMLRTSNINERSEAYTLRSIGGWKVWGFDVGRMRPVTSF